MFPYITPPNGYCPACRRATESEAARDAHNVAVANTGERSYLRAVNVSARTVEARKMRQGSGVRAIAVGWGQ